MPFTSTGCLRCILSVEWGDKGAVVEAMQRTADNAEREVATVLRLIAEALARAGQENFHEPFLGAVERLGADQCMVFAYAPDSARCLLARNFRAGVRGRRLAATYVDGWFRADPLYREALAMPEGACRVVPMAAIADAMSETYRERFFAAPGLSGKTAVLTASHGLRLAVNLYRTEAASRESASLATVSNAVLQLVAQAAAVHFASLTRPRYPLPLAVLSEREREVCLGILNGRKAEAIAGDMAVSPSSVVTYRRRAYDKLGINSRAALFALCRMES